MSYFMVQKVQQVVESRIGLLPGAINSKRRESQYVTARWTAIALCRDLMPHITVTELARLFKRDHTAVIHALKEFKFRDGEKTELYQSAKSALANNLPEKVVVPGEVVASATPENTERVFTHNKTKTSVAISAWRAP